MDGERLLLGSFEEFRHGVPLKYIITTIPPLLTEPVIRHMTTAYLPREPMCSHYKLHKDPKSLATIQEIWREMIESGASLVALKDGPEDESERVIGANITYVTTKNSLKPENIKGTKLEAVYDAVADIAERANIFERYNVDKYLSAFGLSVDPQFHGYKIGERLLQSRRPLCKKLGVKVTATVYTHIKSMYLAKKVGFVVLYEETFVKYKHNGVITFEGLPGKFEESAWYFSE